ncbi:microfibril-associated/Pre-mRNA processing domain-containing protein [Phthorimaea operculella]|nr:microfibril-associated/Pre-mRNA processing domain-containing protein [Phthorimaea operculella]
MYASHVFNLQTYPDGSVTSSYIRGAFYLDKEDEVFKQDFSGATLDDHFDKTVLPKVMQVKKFGRSGRTKYTHLVDQDTTEFDSAWSSEGANTRLTNFRGGMKQVFDRPSAKRKHNV